MLRRPGQRSTALSTPAERLRIVTRVSEIPYRIRRSDRARRARVTVGAEEGVEVVLPRRAPERDAAAVVRELRPWIERRLGELERALAERATEPGVVPYLDERLQVAPEPGRTRAHRAGARLLVPAAEPLPAVERWFRRAARAEIGPRLERACAQAGASYRSLSIRAQRTRWASCSTSGEMSFNWRLLLAPEAVLQTVVWHEVSHIEVPDHSRRFWSLLGSRWPDYREHERWLRRYGATLVLSASMVGGAPRPAATG